MKLIILTIASNNVLENDMLEMKFNSKSWSSNIRKKKKSNL